MKIQRKAIGLLLCFASFTADATTDASLIGCWRSGVTTSHLADGSVRESKASCTLTFEEAKIRSECIGSRGPFSISYAYRIVSAGKYEATIISHDTLATAVGTTREYDYRIDGNILRIETYPQTTTPAPLNAAVRVVSISTRDTGECRIAG